MSANSMAKAEAAVRRFYETLSTGNTTPADEVLTPDWDISRRDVVETVIELTAALTPRPPVQVTRQTEG